MMIDISDDNFGAVLNCAVRYALGRHTYMPSLVIQQIQPLLREVSDKTLWCFRPDIRDAEKRNRLGDECDASDWLWFCTYVEMEITHRKSTGQWKLLCE